MSLSPAQRLAEALEQRRQSNSLRRLSPPNPSFTDFCSNDYLGLARSSVVRDRVLQEWEKLSQENATQWLGSGGSRLLAGDSSYAEQLEKELAGFYRSEAGLLFNSGYAANTGLFSALPKKGDTVLYDELIHASVRDGLRMSAAKSWSFQHNDVVHLEALLRKAEGAVYVAAEAVYSMDGDECPLEAIVSLCEQYGAALILDEAHSNGLYGGEGEGLAVAKGLHDKIFARVMTFGKAPGCHGAFVAGSNDLRDYLVNFSRPFIYSTALPVHDLAVIHAAVNSFRVMHEARRKLSELIAYFRGNLSGKTHFELLPSASAIQAVLIPGNEEARAVAENCRKEKLDVRAILSPTVPAGEERLRIILHSFNTTAEVDQLIKVIAKS